MTTSLKLGLISCLIDKYVTYFAWLLRSVTFTFPRTKLKYSLKENNKKCQKT